MADVGAGFQIDGNERVRIEVIARTRGAVEVGGRISDDEIDAIRGQIDRRALPHAAAEPLVGVAVLGERRLFRLDVAMQVASGRVRSLP